MNRLKDALIVMLLAGVCLLVASSLARAATPGSCTKGILPSGASSLVCMPLAGWNGGLVVFAHGYVAFNQPLDFYHLTLPDGTSIPRLIQTFGFAFATTTYRQNGLAILEGADDIRELVAAFSETHSPLMTYVTGVSEGGLVATLLIEQSPNLFSGGFAACGPIGSFKGQLDYIGDFRVLFDYYFPHLIPGEPIHIPPTVIRHWDSQYVPAIVAAVQGNPARATELLHVANAASDPADPGTLASTTINILWYSIFGTNDAFAKFGGNPFDNRGRWYSGSSDDVALNRGVHRFNASKAALAALRAYETSGGLSIPMVTLHTTKDEVVPFAHELLYQGKLQLSGRGQFISIPTPRYGHCNFRTAEVLSAFLTLLAQP